MLGVTIKQLRAFVTVAREGSFKCAARRLNVSPSALSIAVRDLEAGLDVSLLQRTTRSVQVVPQASAFLLVTERFLTDLERAVRDVQAVSAGQTGSVVVGGSASFLAFAVAPAIGNMSKAYPGVSITLAEDMTETLSARIRTGEVDFGFATVWEDVYDLTAETVLTDRVGALFSPLREGLLTQAELTWSDLVDLPIIALPKTAGMRTMFRTFPSIFSLIENPSYEVTSNLAMLDLVERDVGVAIMPALSARHQENRRRIFRPLSAPVVWRSLCFLYLARTVFTPVASVLLSHVREVLRELPQDDNVRVKGLEIPDHADLHRGGNRKT